MQTTPKTNAASRPHQQSTSNRRQDPHERGLIRARREILPEKALRLSDDEPAWQAWLIYAETRLASGDGGEPPQPPATVGGAAEDGDGWDLDRELIRWGSDMG